MSDRPYLGRERLLAFAGLNAAGPDGRAAVSNNPNTGGFGQGLVHFTMSPTNVMGQPATGFLFGVHADPSDFASGSPPVAAAGYTITPWRYMPTLGIFASLAPVTGVALDQLVICTDLNPCALFFQITGLTGTDGPFIMSFTEQ